MKDRPWQLQIFDKSLKKKEKLKYIDKHLAIAPSHVILDMGCAQGILSYFLRQKGGHWVSADLDFALDPPPEAYLSPVLTALTQQGLEVGAPDLVSDAAVTLGSLCGWDPTELDERVLALYDDEARAARLRDLARGWAVELRLLSLVVRAGGASASVVRSEAVQVDEILGRPEAPSQLVQPLERLIPGAHLLGLRTRLEEELSDELPGTPAERAQIHRLADAHGIPVVAAPAILKILARDRSRRVATYTHQARALAEHDVQPRQPAGLTAPPPRKTRPGRKHVVHGKVNPEALPYSFQNVSHRVCRH